MATTRTLRSSQSEDLLLIPVEDLLQRFAIPLRFEKRLHIVRHP
jgi:hypothetical protein